MRSSFRSFLIVTTILVFGGACAAHADLITLSISEPASGTLGGQAFTNQPVTFIGSFTTEQFAACRVPFSFE
jgi:hypothetical protein